MKKIIKTIIIILIIIIMCIFIWLLNLKKNGVQKQARDNEGKQAIGVNYNEKSVDSPTTFYTIQNIVQKYLSYTHLDYEKQEQDDTNIQLETLAKAYHITNREEKEKAILNLLDINYIEKNNITLKNINEFIEIDEEGLQECRVLEIREKKYEQFEVYAVYAKVVMENNEEKYEFFKVTLDEYNTTCMIQPIREAHSINEIELNSPENLEKIENTGNNLYTYVRVNEGEMAEKYFKEYKEILLDNTYEAYQKLEEKYRDKRYENYENFQKFVDDNKEEIANSYISKYLTNVKENSREYVCQDNYSNLYIFDTTAVMQYTVQLDTYTIPTEKFTTTYNSSNDQKKVMMNVDKWIQMLNNRDYTAAYKVLDETYRNNTFGSEEQFEAIMREKLPLHYKAEYSNFSEENGIYIQEIELSDITGKSTETIKISIIMQLKEDLDFVMSFSFQEQE